MSHSKTESHDNTLSLEQSLRQFLLSDRCLIETDFCRIMKSRGSDKCSNWHNYTPTYNFLFSSIRDTCKEVFEVGIFFGSSVRGWSDYFHNARITAADVDKNCLVNEGRIESHLCDQDSADSIASLWKSINNRTFDIMIDDGKHEYSSNMNFLRNSIGQLNKGGIYIVEDLTRETYSRMSADLESLKRDLCLDELFLLDIPNPLNSVDNRLMIAIK